MKCFVRVSAVCEDRASVCPEVFACRGECRELAIIYWLSQSVPFEFLCGMGKLAFISKSRTRKGENN